MRYIALLLLTVSIASAQTDFFCSASPESYSKSLFQNKRTARAVRHWTCTITNYSDSPIVLTEGSVIRALHTAGVPAYSVESVRNMFLENQRRGKWKTIGRLLLLIGDGLTLVAAADLANMSNAWRTGITIGGPFLPRLARSAGNRAPSIELFERAAWTVQIGIEPHSTVAVSMFSGPWGGELIINGVFAESVPAEPPLTSQLFPDPIEFAKYIQWLKEHSDGSGTVTLEEFDEGSGTVTPEESDEEKMIWDFGTRDPILDLSTRGFIPESYFSSEQPALPSGVKSATVERIDWASADHASRYGRLWVPCSVLAYPSRVACASRPGDAGTLELRAL